MEHLVCVIFSLCVMLTTAWKCDFEKDSCGISLGQGWTRTDGAGSGVSAPPQDHTFGSHLDICDFESSSCHFNADPPPAAVNSNTWKRYLFKYTRGSAHNPPPTDHTTIRTGTGGYAAWLSSGYLLRKGVKYRWSSDPFPVSTCGLDFWYVIALPSISVTKTKVFARFTLVAENGGALKEIYSDTAFHTGGWKNVKVDIPLGFRAPGSKYHFEITNPSSGSYMTGSYYIDDISFLRCGHFLQSSLPASNPAPVDVSISQILTPTPSERCYRIYSWTPAISTNSVTIRAMAGTTQLLSRTFVISSPSWIMTEVNLPANTDTINLEHRITKATDTLAIDDIEIDSSPCPTTTPPPTSPPLSTVAAATSAVAATSTVPTTTTPKPVTTKPPVITTAAPVVTTAPPLVTSASYTAVVPNSALPGNSTGDTEAKPPRSIPWDLIGAGLGLLALIALSIVACWLCCCRKGRDEKKRKPKIAPGSSNEPLTRA